MSRFDLEQQIFQCWNITEDIQLLYENVMNKNMSTDVVANILLGLKSLYELKFQQCFETFEKLVVKNEG